MATTKIFTATELQNLKNRVNQIFKEQVNPAYAGHELKKEYDFFMYCIDKYESDYASDFDVRMLEDVQRVIDREYKAMLNPETAIVGEGATVCFWSDREAYTIISKSKSGKKLTLRRCKATLDPNFKPDFSIGGFCAHCNNQNDQTYSYEEDTDGKIVTAFWSDKKKDYYADGSRVVKGRREFYDYNF